MKKIIKLSFFLTGLAFILVVMANLIVLSATREQVFEEVNEVPYNKVGLVLGTSHRMQNGDSNMFFFQRIDITARLYREGKIKKVIVSGDNSSIYYNEPLRMKKALIEKEVPDSVIHMDFAGFRTLDSVVRSKLVFGQDSLTIITQDFHSHRALFIANNYGMQAVACVGTGLPLSKTFKTEIREVLARTLSLFDIYLLDTAPKFLGKKETLDI